MQSVAITVLNTTELDQYHITEAARAIAGFVDELSNWYVRRSRDRFWGGERTADNLPPTGRCNGFGDADPHLCGSCRL